MKSIRKLPIAILALGLLFAVNASPAFAAPTVKTLVATEVAGTSATLNGTVTAESSHFTRYAFGYGTSSDWKEFTGDTPVETTQSSSPIEVGAHITGLTPETTYYYVIGAFDTVTNQYVNGEVGSFKTTANNGLRFRAVEYPATVSGSLGQDEKVFTAAEGKLSIKCTTRNLSGSLSEASTSLTFLPELTSCTSSLLGEVTVKMNSCRYQFTVNKSLFLGVATGDAFVTCGTEGDKIEYVNGSGCAIRLAAQADPLSSFLTHTNTGPASARTISTTGATQKLKWSFNFPICAKLLELPASGEDGEIIFEGATLKGTNSKGAYNEFYVAG